MHDIPTFFIPPVHQNILQDNQEAIYAGLAEFCRATVPPVDERIYSITFKHDGEEWIATVGQQLRGSRHEMRGKGSRKREVASQLTDQATVLAIFPGHPFFVVTNKRINEEIRSQWENPFMAGNPTSIIQFRPS